MTDLPVTYNVTDSAIAELRTQLAPLTADTRDGYESVRKAIATCRDLRGEVEKKRRELKEDSLAWGRKVDTEAKRITGLLLEIEEPLKAKKQVVDDERERIRREKEAAEREAFEAKIRAENEAREAKAREEREYEELRQRVEAARLKKEREQLEAERAKVEAEKRAAAEAQRVAREKLEAERRAVEAEKQRLAEAEEARKREQEVRNLLLKAPDISNLPAMEEEARKLEEQHRRETDETNIRKADEAMAAKYGHRWNDNPYEHFDEWKIIRYGGTPAPEPPDEAFRSPEDRRWEQSLPERWEQPIGEFSACVVHWWSSEDSGDHALDIVDEDLVARVRDVVEKRLERLKAKEAVA